MTTRKLSSEEIDYLFTFVEQREVKYYDVQMELVDHFASAIETQWESNPKLSFDEALRMEHKQFNKYDFNRIIDEKESALKKKYVQLQWKYIGDFFKLPKILITATIFTSLLAVLEFSNKLNRVYAVAYAAALIWVITLITLKKGKTKINLLSVKSFVLFEEYKRIRGGYLASLNFANFLNLPIFIFGASKFYEYLQFDLVKLLIAIIFTAVIILSYVLTVYLPSRIKADFIREYPQFVKA